jgi:hypothetical protein
MKRFVLTAGGALALALTATAASAASLSGFGAAAPRGLEAGIVKVHGVHRSCEEGRFGWHRSTPWGREACRPHFNRGWGWGGWGGGWRGPRHDYDGPRHGWNGGRHDRDDDFNDRPRPRVEQAPPRNPPRNGQAYNQGPRPNGGNREWSRDTY